MPTVARFDRSLPRTGGKLGDCKREFRPELLGQTLRPALTVVVLEHETIGERRGEPRGLGLTSQLRKRMRRIVACPGTPPVRREIQVAEAEAGRLRERITVLLIPALELVLRRFVRGSDVLCEELHLLGHPTFDDGVALVEPERQPLAVENFLLHPILDETVQLFWRRVAPPLRLEQE